MNFFLFISSHLLSFSSGFSKHSSITLLIFFNPFGPALPEHLFQILDLDIRQIRTTPFLSILTFQHERPLIFREPSALCSALSLLSLLRLPCSMPTYNLQGHPYAINGKRLSSVLSFQHPLSPSFYFCEWANFLMDDTKFILSTEDPQRNKDQR